MSVTHELDQHKVVLINKNMSYMHLLVKPCIAKNYFKIFELDVLVRLPCIDVSFTCPGRSQLCSGFLIELR